MNRMRYFIFSLILLLLSATDVNSQAKTITQFNGNGAINTKPFETTGPWQIEWKGDLVIAVYTGDGTTAGLFHGVDQKSYMPKAGRYYLSIAGSNVPWTVTIKSAE
jgi:hypothetical protein